MAKKKINKNRELKKENRIKYMGKNTNNKKITLIIVGILVLTSIILLLSGVIQLNSFNNSNSQNLDNKINLEDFYDSDCNCLERGRAYCLSGFELNENKTFCINTTSKTYTNIVDGCSNYVCGNQSYIYNLDLKNWEAKE